MNTALRTRPQQIVGVENGASRYDADGRLWVKHASEWMVFPRYAAARFLERQGLALPKGVRVEVADRTRPATVHNLTLKFRGKRQRVRLIDFAREIGREGHTSQK